MGKRVQKLLIYIFIRVSRDVVVPPLLVHLVYLQFNPLDLTDPQKNTPQKCPLDNCIDIITSVSPSTAVIKMKGTKVQTLGGRAVAGAWLVAWAIMAMGAIINTHAHR